MASIPRRNTGTTFGLVLRGMHWATAKLVLCGHRHAPWGCRLEASFHSTARMDELQRMLR
jgi:hypothetical protein